MILLVCGNASIDVGVQQAVLGAFVPVLCVVRCFFLLKEKNGFLERDLYMGCLNGKTKPYRGTGNEREEAIITHFTGIRVT